MEYDVQRKEDCVGVYRIYRYTLARNTCQEMLKAFSKLGKLKVYDDFPKPCFIIASVDTTLKGVLGSNFIEITLYDPITRGKENLEQLLKQIE